MSSDEQDWIFDFVLQFLESDRFDSEVMDFVDEKCAFFDTGEENMLEWTEIHNEFRDHIEAVIVSNLCELDITTEIFLEACKIGLSSSRDINLSVYDKIVAMDDFLTFKKMMIKRNMELELETIRAYKLLEGDMDEEEFEELLRASLATPLTPLPDAEELEEIVSAKQNDFEKNADDMTVDEMQKVLRNSLMEMQLISKQDEMEQLEMEHALAMSIALEEERLRLLSTEIEIQQLRADSEQLRDESDSKGLESPMFGSKEVDSRFERRPMESKLAQPDEPKYDESDGNSSPTEKRVKKTFKPTSKVLLDVPEPKPLKMPKSFAPLPDIKGGPVQDLDGGRRTNLQPLTAPVMMQKMDELEEKKRLATEAFSRNQQVLQKQKEMEAELRNQVQEPVGEAQKRAQHMREQRDRLIAIKKAEREAKVRAEEERRGALGGAHVGKGDSTQAKESSNADSKEKDAKDEMAEKRRAMMHNALARRMKQELYESSEQKQAAKDEEGGQYSDLDRQLRLVEKSRKESQQRAILMQDQVRRQQEVMNRR